MVPAARRLAGLAEPVLVPVPLAPPRRRERGFNQAELLAEAIASITGWTTAPVLRRTAGGPAQAGQGREARVKHSVGAYEVDDRIATAEPVCHPGISDRPHSTEIGGPAGGRVPLLLVDDVVTTGATAAACLGELRSSGLHCIGMVSFARTASALGLA
jgi:predicted amidophosphoribosyltransferase